MEGERDLSTLIQRMTPAVHPEIFVFCSLPNCQLQPGLAPVGTFFEAEGLTVIVPLRQALDLKLKHQFESRMLTLTVHSALDAVGFLASVSAALAANGIACNVVSAYYHDHIFVPKDKLADAVQALRAMTAPVHHGV